MHHIIWSLSLLFSRNNYVKITCTERMCWSWKKIETEKLNCVGLVSCYNIDVLRCQQFCLFLASTRQNSYEELVYWSEEDNYNKLNQEQLLMSNFEYFERELVTFWIYTR